MLDVDQLQTEMDKLSSQAIAQIVHSLHDLKDGTVSAAAMRILRKRHSTPGGQWETRDRECPSGSCVVVGSCRSGSGPADPAHQIAETFHYEYRDEHERSRLFKSVTCSCGVIINDWPLLRWRQVLPNARVWPVVQIHVESAGQQIPHFRVCKLSAHAQDALHAPDPTGLSCLCGAYLEPDSANKLLPMY